jgi:hypothetical protein
MSAADFTLNPLPSSVQWASSLFTLRDVGTPFTMPAGVSRVLYGTVGDLTGDGWPEVVISGWSYRGFDATGTPPNVPISIFSVTASGVTQLSAQTLLGVTGSPGTAMLRIADFTGDGRNDLLMVGHNESPFVNTTSTLWVASASGFTAQNVGPKLAAHEGEASDVNGDGRLDYVVSAYYTERVLDSYLYTGNAGNWVQGNSAQTPLLLLQMNQGGGVFQSYPLALSSTISELKASSTPWLATNWSSGSAAMAADLDGDGRAEVIVVDLRASGNWTRGDNYIITDLRFDATSAAGRLIALPTPYFDDKPLYASMQSNYGAEKTHDIQVQVMDFDNDGRQDILIHTMVWHNDTPAGVVQFLRNKGGLSFEDVTDSVLYNSYLGKAESSHDSLLMDVNGDGFVDIVSSGEPVYITGGSKPNTWSNEVLINTGAGKFVSVMWNQFHSFTVAAGSPYDQRMFPYMTPDGRLGFIGTQFFGDNTEFINIEATAPIGTGPGGIDPATRGAPGFNEAYYLTQNPTVAAAVTAGQYATGLDHFLAAGRAQGLAGFASGARVTGSDAAETITLREGNERATGGAGADTIIGGAGSDSLMGVSVTTVWLIPPAPTSCVARMAPTTSGAAPTSMTATATWATTRSTAGPATTGSWAARTRTCCSATRASTSCWETSAPTPATVATSATWCAAARVMMSSMARAVRTSSQAIVATIRSTAAQARTSSMGRRIRASTSSWTSASPTEIASCWTPARPTASASRVRTSSSIPEMVTRWSWSTSS